METDIDIFVFGDSITYGLTDKQLGGWVNRLKMNLEKQTNREYYVLNLGIPLQTSKDVLMRFDDEMRARICYDDRTVIIFAIGTKNTRIESDIEDYKDDILNLYKSAKHYTNDIYFVGLTRANEELTNEYHNTTIKKYDDALAKTCRKNNINYIKLYDLIKKNDLVNGVYPNYRGHKKISNRITDVILTIK